MGDIFAIIEQLGIPGVQYIKAEIALSVLAAFVVYALVNMYTEGDDWKIVNSFLIIPQTDQKGTGTPATLYRQKLEDFMGWFDRKLNPEAVKRKDAPTAWSRAWGWRLYDRCLLLSLVYPVVFTIVQWTMLGSNISIKIGNRRMV